MIRFVFVLFLLLVLGCESEEELDAGVGGQDAEITAPCPTSIEVDDVIDVQSPNPQPDEITWGVKGFGMATLPGGHDGATIVEVLRTIEDEDTIINDFSPPGVGICPFAGGDVARLFTCGVDEKSFTVGDSMVFAIQGRRVAQYPARTDVFWDNISIVADGSVLAGINDIRVADGQSELFRCRAGCIQTYHCSVKTNPAISLFYRVEDYVLDQATNNTFVVLQTVDEDGNSF